MENLRQQSHFISHALQSLLLIAAQGAALLLVGRLLLGADGALLALLLTAMALLLGSAVSPQVVLRLYRARPLTPNVAPELSFLLQQLAQRAGLATPPRLYYIPSPALNAFALGSRQDSAIAVTDGLLRMLNRRELLGVLAHEVSHIRHGDIWLMALSSAVTRITLGLSQLGQLLFIVALPLWLLGIVVLSPLALLLLILAPGGVYLLQLALSRTREFEADRGAALLTQDPNGLAAALAKLERYQQSWWQRLMPGASPRQPSEWLLTHPPTPERIRRLQRYALRVEGVPLHLTSSAPHQLALLERYPALLQRPFWHLGLRG